MSRQYQTDTATGAAWVEKYLHPPSALRSSYNGIPDLNTTPSVNLEYRLESEQPPPQTSTSTLFIMPSSPYVHAFRFNVRPGPNYQDESDVIPPNPNIDLKDFSKSAESYRMAYRSTTFYQDSTAFNNAGMIYTAAFRPNVAEYNERQLGLFTDRFSRHKGFKDAVKHLQKPSELADEFTELTVSPKAPSQGNVVQVISLGKIPTTGGEVLMRSPKSVARRANEGAFVVQQFSEPTQSYKSMARSYDKRQGQAPISYSVFNFYEYEVGGDLVLASFKSVPGGSNCPDLPWYEMTWAFVLYTPAIGANEAAPLLLKTIVGIEVQPTSGSLLQAVVKDAPLYDQQALRMASMMRQQMPDSLPSSANDFSSFIGAALNWAPKIFDAIKSIFAPKPTMSQVGKIVRETVPEVVEMKASPRPARVQPSAPPKPAPVKKRVRVMRRAQTQAAPVYIHQNGEGKTFATESRPRRNRRARSIQGAVPQSQRTGAQNISGSAPTAQTVRPRSLPARR